MKAPTLGHLGLRKRKMKDTDNEGHEGGKSKRHCLKRTLSLFLHRLNPFSHWSGNRSPSFQKRSDLEDPGFELMEMDVHHEERELDSKL